MKVTMLGCGTSVGVPALGQQDGDHNSNDSRNRRQRWRFLLR